MYLTEDVGVAIKEGEEDDVDDGEVEGYEHDDGFGEGEEKRAPEVAAEAPDERFGGDFEGGGVAVVGG